MRESIKALIPARSGSLRVKNKNIRPFADSNLLTIKINQLFRIKEIDSVVVNSNDDEILNIAKNLGCETVKRDPYFASDSVCMSEVYVDMALNFDSDIVLFADCTNPLVKDETIKNAIETYFEKTDDVDSLNSAHKIKEFLFKNNKPLNYDLQNVPRSQDLPDIYALNFAISIIPQTLMLERRNIVGYNPFLLDIGKLEGLDIDDEIDFKFGEYLYKNQVFSNTFSSLK